MESPPQSAFAQPPRARVDNSGLPSESALYDEPLAADHAPTV